MKQATEVSQRPLLGICLKITAIVLLVTMMVAIKLVHTTVPVGQIVFVRSIIGLVTVYLFYTMRPQLNGAHAIHQLRMISIRNHLPWAIAAAAAMSMWFVAITLIPLPEATAIGFIMPLLVVAFAWLILGEKIRLVRSVAVASGLIGVTIIVWPRLGLGADYQSQAAIGAALALGAAILWAYAQICLRQLTKTESSGSSVVSFSVATLCLSLVTVWFGWHMPDATGWFWLIVCGVTGGLGQLCTAESLRYATPSTLAPFEYLSFPVASLAAIIIFTEHPHANIWWGLPFVIAGGLLVIVREYQLKSQS